MKKPKFEVYIASGKMDRLFRQILKMWRKQKGLTAQQFEGDLWSWQNENKNHFGHYNVIDYILTLKHKKITYLKHHREQFREICFLGTPEECESHLQKMFDDLKRKEKLQSFT